MWKLQRNYLIAYSLQIIHKHNKNRLNQHVKDKMVEEQCGFIQGRSCTNAIFTVQQIIEKEKNTTYRYFFYLEIMKRHTITWTGTSCEKRWTIKSQIIY